MGALKIPGRDKGYYSFGLVYCNGTAGGNIT
jgi:hypothetical protein